MFVRTERLFLRPAWPEDLDEIVEALLDGDIQRRPGVCLPDSVEGVRAYIERPRDPRLPHFFMYLRAPGGPQLVGGIGLARQDGEVEVFHWIVPSQRGRGFAGEGLRAVLAQARALGYLRVIASHVGDDAATHEVLESAGFRDTGQVRSRYSAGQAMEFAVRIYEADLERRKAPRAGIRRMAMDTQTAA